jgi:hypothetical protein
MVFLLVCLLAVLMIFSADQGIPVKIKKLEQKLNKLAGQEKVDLLNELGKQYQNIDPKKSIDYGNEALTLSKKKGDCKTFGTDLGWCHEHICL